MFLNLSVNHTVYAQDEDTFSSESCSSVDLVVLLDQSKSMGENDSEGLRFKASRTIIEFLGNHASWFCFEQDVNHRLAIVGFGDQTSIGYQDDVEFFLEPAVIPEVNDISSWRQEKRELRDQLLTAEVEAKEVFMGATDHISAFSKAIEIFDDWDSSVQDLSNTRRKVIVVLTDGGPCRTTDGCGVEGSEYTYETAMEELRNFADPQSKNLPWSGNNDESVYISMIALSGSGDNYQDIPILREGWDAIVKDRGEVYEANDQNTDLSLDVAEILDPLIGTGMLNVPCDADLPILPYVDDVVIFYLFAQRSSTGNLDDVLTTINIERNGEILTSIKDGRSSSIAGQEVIQEHEQDGPNEFYILSPALPGSYSFDVENVEDKCEDLEGKVQKNSIRANVLSPDADVKFAEVIEAPHFIQENAVPFRISLEMRGAQDEAEGAWTPLLEYPEYPLNIQVNIESPENTHSQVLDLRRVEDGVYESDQFIKTPYPGRYDWKVVASTDSPIAEGETIDVFQEAEIELIGSFFVGDVTKFGFEIISPVPNTEHQLNTVNEGQQAPSPITVEVQLTDEGGNALSRDVVLQDVDDVFVATLLTADSEVVETIALNPQAGSDAGFSGTFSNSAENGILSAGEYVIAVEANWNSENHYDYTKSAPINSAKKLSINQYEVFPLTVKVTASDAADLLFEDWRTNIPSGGLSTFRKSPIPFDISVQIINAKTGDIIDPDDAFETSADFDQAIFVSPEKVTERISLTLDIAGYEGSIRSQETEIGDYVISVDASNVATTSAYAWGDAVATTTVSRTVTPFTSPNVIRGILAAIALLLAFLIYKLIHTFSGGPEGILKIEGKDPTGYSDDPVTLVEVSLSRFKRVNKFTSHELSTIFGAKHMLVSKTEPLDPDTKYAVQVKIVAKKRGQLALFDDKIDANSDLGIPFEAYQDDDSLDFDTSPAEGEIFYLREQGYVPSHDETFDNEFSDL